MKELTKSMISLSWATGLAALRGVSSLANRSHRDRFLKNTEDVVHDATDATVNNLGKNLRETFEFADNIQRRVIDAGAGVVSSVLKPKGPSS